MRILKWSRIVMNGKLNWFNLLTYIWLAMFGTFLVVKYFYYMVAAGHTFGRMAVQDSIERHAAKMV